MDASLPGRSGKGIEMLKWNDETGTWSGLLVAGLSLALTVGCGGSSSTTTTQSPTEADKTPTRKPPVVIDLDTPLGESLTKTPEKRKADAVVQRWLESKVQCEYDELGNDVTSITVPADAKDDLLVGIHEVGTLKSITLAENSQMTDDGLAHLAKSKSLESLRLNAARDVSIEGLRSVAKIESLRVLDASGLSVGNASLDALNEATGLRELNLSWTRVDDEAMAKMSNLPALESLDLSYTHVSDAQLDDLLGLAELRYLNLEGTLVSEAAVKRLRQKAPRLVVDGFEVEMIENPAEKPPAEKEPAEKGPKEEASEGDGDRAPADKPAEDLKPAEDSKPAETKGDTKADPEGQSVAEEKGSSNDVDPEADDQS